jgi:hypothetical protein
MNKVSLDVRSEIMDKVEEIQPDILVLGARGLGTVRGYLHHHPPWALQVLWFSALT